MMMMMILPPLYLQGKQVLKDGIGRAPEEEEPVDPALARQFLQARLRCLSCRPALNGGCLACPPGLS